MKDLMVTVNKFYVLFGQEIILAYCMFTDEGEQFKYEFKDEKNKKNLLEADMLFINLYKKGGEKTA